MKHRSLIAIKQVKELLSEKERWTKNHSARNADGEFVEPYKKEIAVCWCLSGAIERVAFELDTSYISVRNPFDTTRKQHFPGFIGIIDFNDSPETEHSDVLLLLDLTIGRLERLAA